jgi:Ca2+-binding RTX toxin-like protein
MFGQVMGALNDTIHGGDGNDLIMAGGGGDWIYGGRGDDIMYGLGGNGVTYSSDADTFWWLRGDAGGNAVDVIRDFNAMNIKDTINIHDLLEGYFSGDDISEWVKITNNYTASQDGNRSGSLITIDVDGAGARTETQYIFLTNTTLDTVENLVQQGVLVV